MLNHTSQTQWGKITSNWQRRAKPIEIEWGEEQAKRIRSKSRDKCRAQFNHSEWYFLSKFIFNLFNGMFASAVGTEKKKKNIRIFRCRCAWMCVCVCGVLSTRQEHSSTYYYYFVYILCTCTCFAYCYLCAKFYYANLYIFCLFCSVRFCVMHIQHSKQSCRIDSFFFFKFDRIRRLCRA